MRYRTGREFFRSEGGRVAFSEFSFVFERRLLTKLLGLVTKEERLNSVCIVYKKKMKQIIKFEIASLRKMKENL